MTKEEILNVIRGLAKSQGCWGRLLASLNELEPEDRESVLQDWEDRNFQDSLDLILFLEGNA